MALAGTALYSQVNVQRGKKLSYRERQKVLKNLPPRYKRWYNIIYHISTKDERDVFLSLTNTRDRDIFIRSFWLQRDPTPGTEDNEYKKEIENRFAHVNKIYSRSSSKPGWMTDMGKFYMILGKPSTEERYDSKAGLRPAVVWYYYGDTSLGLPTYFSLMFYRPHGTTEFKFYNPSVEGPAELLIQQGPVDDTDYRGLYQQIYELAPQLAMPAITMIPNHYAPGFRPPMRNNLVVSNIHSSPVRKINLSYATHFLNYKGFVDVESSINYIENSRLVSVTRYNRFGLNFVNISMKPRKISVGYNDEREQYYFNYQLSVNLRKGDKFIYEYKKNFDFYVEEQDLASLKGNGIVIHDSFPVIPGEYDLTVFAMNSVGKEFTYFDSRIKVPAIGGAPSLTQPVVGYKAQKEGSGYFYTYNFNGEKLYVDTQKNMRFKEAPIILVGAYNLARPLWEAGKIQMVLKSQRDAKKFTKTYDVPLKQYDFNRDINLMQKVGHDVGGLAPDYYDLEVRLVDGSGKTLDTQKAEFAVSPMKTFGYARETLKQIRADNPYFFLYTLGTQYQKLGNTKQAEHFFNRCVTNNPAFKPGYVALLNILNKTKKYTRVLVEVEKLNNDKEYEFDYHLIKATALYGMKDYQEALTHLVKANTIYNSDTRALNLMGFTLLNLNEYKEALRAFEASLNMDNKQDFIKKTVEQVKDRMKSGALKK